MATSREKCLIAHCKNKAATRGLCRSCYQIAQKLVRTKQTTWGELVEAGAALPDARSLCGKSRRVIMLEAVARVRTAAPGGNDASRQATPHEKAGQRTATAAGHTEDAPPAPEA